MKNMSLRSSDHGIRYTYLCILKKKYTDDSMAGGGISAGKNCAIDSIEEISGGNRVTFKWTLDNGTVKTGTMDVMDGEKGEQGIPGATGSTGQQGAQGPKAFINSGGQARLH